MGVVPFERLQPLCDIGGTRLLMIFYMAISSTAPIGKLAPNQVPHAICMIKETLLEDFLMQPRAVKAYGHTQFDIAAQGFIAGSSHNPIGVVTLIEHQALEQFLAVQCNGLSFDGDAA